MNAFSRRARVVVAAVALGLVGVRLLSVEYGARVDSTTLFLLGTAAAVLLVPWERLESFRGGNVEITVTRPEVKAAVETLQLDSRLETEQLLATIETLGSDVDTARGGRVLWVDDNPHKLLGERRILRALGVTVTTAASSERAVAILDEDNDFDLLVSDVQRVGESYRYNDGNRIHEGVNFVCRLRDHADPNISRMRVIFYASYPWEKLVEYTRPARERLPEADLVNTSGDLIEGVVRNLAAVRTDPIEYPGTTAQKKPTAYTTPTSGMPSVDMDSREGATALD
ncbi:response regulator [Salinigranum halophilum]|uniref:response regulator n=1 Tax=Salinigranum halophilum TaxID=2565931 RepID=UPI0010A8EC5B|nr:response regulator [Salinigranum halophilum]